MALEYGFGVTFDTVSTWIAPGGTFNWTSPVFGTTVANAVDGNAVGRVSGLGGTISGLNWVSGRTLWIRWIEVNDFGNDHGLSIDNFSFAWGAHSPLSTVTNVRASQRSGTELVDIYYDLSAQSSSMTVELQVSANGGFTFSVPAASLNGDVGSGNHPGSNKHIVWNAGADWDGQFSTQMKFKVTATGSPGSTGTGYASNATVDTRTLTMTQLTVTGPSSIPWGSQGAYTATLHYQGAASEDVTAQCEWSVSGGPQITNYWELPFMAGNILNPKVASPILLHVTARVTRDTGGITSPPFAVTVTESNGMNVGIAFLSPSQTGPVYVRPVGSNFTWQVVAEAHGLAADKPGVTFQWSLDGEPLATGRTLNEEITGMPGTRQLSLLATDPAARTGQAFWTLVFDPPPAPNEPPRLIPAVDPYFGEVLDEDGDPFAFDPLKTPNGLIVVTHGTYETGDADWLLQMAKSIRLRLDADGKPLPNILVFGWGKLSDPTKYWGFDAVRGRALDRAKSALVGVPIILTSLTVGTVADYILVRPHGQSEGQELADFIRTEIGNGNVVPGQKIHLIGHSAGGFVAGECGWQLRNLCSDLRVTMLDTPFPFFNHLWRYPGAGRKLDRYVSSLFGLLEYPTTLGASLFSANESYSMLLSTSPLAGPTVPFPSAHSYSHQWYEGTVIDGTPGAQGFGWSPFLQPASFASFADLVKDGPTTQALAPVDTTVPLNGFTTFGAVTPDAEGFVLTEGLSQNAGITCAAMAFPAGTHSLRFRFQFTTPGDGDFLSVSFGDNPPIFTGKDMPLTRDGELTTDVPVEHLAGQQGDLVFRLVSRGQQNAVMTLHEIVAVTVEDADQDGLSNATEVALGTSAMSADTDADGVSDAAEADIHLTNPLRADTDGDGSPDGAELAAATDPKNPASRLLVTSTAFAPAGFSLQWSAETSRSYRVLRSPTPDFMNYDVIGSALPGVSPLKSLIDTAVQPGSEPQMFYKIEIEPQP